VKGGGIDIPDYKCFSMFSFDIDHNVSYCKIKSFVWFERIKNATNVMSSTDPLPHPFLPLVYGCSDFFQFLNSENRTTLQNFNLRRVQKYK
jgi:hypothetical protein